MQPLLSQGSAGSDDELIDIGRLYRAVMRHRWPIVGLAFAITLFAGLVVFAMQPVYRASASLVLESQQANLVGVEEVYSVGRMGFDYAYTQFEILKSRNLAERVVRKLQLHKHSLYAHPEGGVDKSWFSFNLKSFLPSYKKSPPVQLTKEQKEEAAIQSVTSSVMGGLSFSPVPYSLMSFVEFESSDPNLAAQVANAIAEEFIDSNLESRLSGTLQATEWLDTRLEDLKYKLRESERALQDFRDQEGLVNVEGTTGLGGNELKSLAYRLDEARKARVSAENIMKDVKGLDNASTEELMTIPAVLEHQLLSELKREYSKIDRKVAELGKRYGPKHPKMIAAQSDLITANRDLAKEVRKVVSGINREYEVALRTQKQLEETWEARKSEMQEFNRKEFRLQELQREVMANRELYTVFFTRVKSISETGGFEKPHARIVDRAVTPGSPVRPNKKLSLGVAFLVGILLGCCIAIALDVLDNTIKSPEDVQDKLGVPLLGSIPRQKLDKNGEFEQFWQNPQSPYSEALRTIRTGVVLSSMDEPAKVIVVTSTLPGEGKSTIALNLGAALAQMENTLVIGADLRRPSLAQRCNMAANHQGLSHFVSGRAELKDCIEYLEEIKMYVMPAGVIPPNPLEMISSKRFVDALTYLRGRFDRIVIDSAPVHAVSDPLILASYADSVIYVVKADSTPSTLAEKCIRRIVASNEPLTGVVLNQFDPEKIGGYYGGDYYQYGGRSLSEEST